MKDNEPMKLELGTLKRELLVLLGVSDYILVQDGRFVALDKSAHTLVTMPIIGLEIDKEELYDLSSIRMFMNSTTISTVMLDFEKQFIKASVPIRYSKPLPRSSDDDWMREVIGAVSVLDKILAKKSVSNPYNKKKLRFVRFPKVEADEFRDIVELVNDKNNMLRIRTGGTLRVTNVDTDEHAEYTKMFSKNESEIVLGRENTTALIESLKIRTPVLVVMSGHYIVVDTGTFQFLGVGMSEPMDSKPVKELG